MSALDYFPRCTCSTCDGRGTVDIPGAPICDVCPRCRGMGTMRGVERARAAYVSFVEWRERLIDLRRCAVLASAGDGGEVST